MVFEIKPSGSIYFRNTTNSKEEENINVIKIESQQSSRPFKSDNAIAIDRQRSVFHPFYNSKKIVPNNTGHSKAPAGGRRASSQTDRRRAEGRGSCTRGAWGGWWARRRVGCRAVSMTTADVGVAGAADGAGGGRRRAGSPAGPSPSSRWLPRQRARLPASRGRPSGTGTWRRRRWGGFKSSMLVPLLIDLSY